MSRQLAGAQPGATVSAQPSVIAAAPVRYVQTDAGVATPRPTPIPIPFAGPFPALVTPPPAPFYPMGPSSAFPPVMPPGTFPGPRAYLDPPPPPPGVLGPYPGIPSRPTVDPRSITQYPVCPGPPPVAPPIYPPPVAPPNIPHFKVYIGKIAPTVDNNFVISLLQVCGVVKSWEPVRNPIDGTHTGFGFCEFESAEGCHRAWRLLNKLSIDGQELVLNVDQATRDAPFRYSDTDKDAMERIRSMIEERTKTKLPRPPTLVVQVSACTVDNGNDDAQSSALEERKTRRQCENEEHLGGMKDVGSQCKKDREVTAAVKSSLQIDEAPLMHVRMERESAVEHESKNQHRKRDGFRKSNVEEKGRERKAVGWDCWKDREVSAAGKSSPRIDEAPLMHVRMERESAVEHESKNQHRKRDGFRKSNVEEKGRERKAVGWDCWKDREVSAAGKSSPRIDEAPLMHVRMERESAVEHESKNQHRKRDGFRKSNVEEKGRERKAVGWDCWKDREVSAAGKSSLRIDEAPSRHVPMECESAVEHARKNQHRKRDGVCKSNGEEKRIVFVPGLVSDKQNTSAGEKVALELRATSKSGEKKPLDAKQLLATVPKMKEELFAHDVNWAIYDKYGLHDRMRPWISKKTAQVFDEELAEFVDYVVAATEEHVTAPRMLELLESLLDDDAERFVLLMWRKLIFEIKKVEEGLA